MKQALSIFFSIVLSIGIGKAQQNLSITGSIKNTKGIELEAATVFIAGSQKITVTDKKGAFQFTNLTPGTYQVVINSLGYEPIKKNLLLSDSMLVLDTVMQEKQIQLDVVVIGDDSQRKNFMKTFTKYFMGESENAKACKIINPEKIEFGTNKKLLKAYSNDFLIIENGMLGYRIKYLLRNFQYDSGSDATFYDGESIFENIEGSSEQKQVWEANRKKAYEGSLMHYLRALHANKTQEEGFLTYTIQNFSLPLVITPNPVFAEQLIQHTDSNFISFKYKKRLYTLYDKKKAMAEQKPTNRKDMTIDMADTGSILTLNAAIDKRGSYSDYKAILIQGFWGRKRLADQLPIEYEPL
ncbi:MAG: carboxypeptidase-like regulatory domain-containing protein [Pedobacter sp.]|nr:MAG: carboxypeptidase-like regulatory domain-containing protein [Pedobacter sp.]